MKPKSYETVLKETAAPSPDGEARVFAKRAALAEFARVNAEQVAPPPIKTGFIQGLLGALRLSRERQSHGSDVMGWNARSKMFAGAASVCLAVVGFVVVWPMIKDGDSKRLLETEPTGLMVPEPARGETPAPEPAASASATVEARQSEGKTTSGLEALPSQDHSTVRDLKEQRAAKNEVSKDDARKKSEGDAQPADASTAQHADEGPSEVLVQALRRTPVISTPQNSPAVAVAQAEEVVATGARVNARTPPHKGVAAPARGALANVASADGRVLGLVNEPTSIAPLPAEGRDKFEHFDSNAVKQVADDPVSTFSADVDTSSYSFVRKQLNAGVLPQKDAVRAEEMINYFDYSWPAAESRERPFRPTVVVSDSPWGKGRKLVHIGIKGYELDARQRPDANLVMLLDVSGSMSSPDKLPLVKESMRLMVNGLKPTDTVAIVVYAGAAGTVLPPTRVGEKEKILAALDALTSGGSTAGAEGIELAYQLAESSFRKEGVNRILLCTDGDFNVGIDNTSELKGFVERKREKGIFLSVLGFGQGNYRDELAQALAQNGNGVAAYIDTLSEAQKVLVQEAGSSLFTIAKDVKLQVEFNPATVAEYRLVGYETRALKREDFNNDAVDAGDVGSGHSVTAIYEITPVGVDARMVEPGRYAKKSEKPVVSAGNAGEYGFLKIRYKLPESSKSQLIEQPIHIGSDKSGGSIARDVQFSTAVAGFAQLLRGGQYTGTLSYDDVIRQGLAARGDDPFGYRNEFVQLVRRAQSARGM